MTLDHPFRLTPNTGNRLREVQTLADDHNVRTALSGHGVMETSLGRSIAFLLQSRAVAALGRADAGLLSQDHAPEVSGHELRLPASRVRLMGEPVRTAAQTISLAGLDLGDYAIVVEAYRALIGATTAGRASEPQLYATVTDGANKPTPEQFYPAGCIDLPSGPSDAPLVTATVQTQKYEQWQYRVRLIQDRDLTGYVSDLIPNVPRYEDLPDGEQVPGSSYAHMGDGLFEALLPDVPASYARAYDRRLYAFKLGVVRVGAAGAEVLTHQIAREQAWRGAPPAVVLPGRLELAEATAAELMAQTQRLLALEATRGALDLRTNEAFAVPDEALGGSALARCIPFPAAEGELPGVTHDPHAAPAQLRAAVNCRLRVTASATFAPSSDTGSRGLRILKNGLPSGFAQVAGNAPGTPNAINVSAEISLKAGETLMVEVVQRSGSVLLATDAALSISRLG